MPVRTRNFEILIADSKNSINSEKTIFSQQNYIFIRKTFFLRKIFLLRIRYFLRKNSFLRKIKQIASSLNLWFRFNYLLSNSIWLRVMLSRVMCSSITRRQKYWAPSAALLQVPNGSKRWSRNGELFWNTRRPLCAPRTALVDALRLVASLGGFDFTIRSNPCRVANTCWGKVDVLPTNFWAGREISCSQCATNQFLETIPPPVYFTLRSGSIWESLSVVASRKVPAK